METKDISHLSIGGLLAPVKSLVKKETLMSAAKLGAGAAGGIIGVNLLLSKVPFLAQNIPLSWRPLATAAAGIMGAGLAKRFVGEKVATGIIAGTVGVAISQMVDRFTSGSSAATAAAQAVAADSSMSGLSGLSGGSRFAGLLPSSQMYGIGTPDMSAHAMFNGATVAIEEGGLHGAAVAIEEPRAFAGFIS